MADCTPFNVSIKQIEGGYTATTDVANCECEDAKFIFNSLSFRFAFTGSYYGYALENDEYRRLLHIEVSFNSGLQYSTNDKSGYGDVIDSVRDRHRGFVRINGIPYLYRGDVQGGFNVHNSIEKQLLHLPVVLADSLSNADRDKAIASLNGVCYDVSFVSQNHTGFKNGCNFRPIINDTIRVCINNGVITASRTSGEYQTEQVNPKNIYYEWFDSEKNLIKSEYGVYDYDDDVIRPNESIISGIGPYKVVATCNDCRSEATTPKCFDEQLTNITLSSDKTTVSFDYKIVSTSPLEVSFSLFYSEQAGSTGFPVTKIKRTVSGGSAHIEINLTTPLPGVEAFISTTYLGTQCGVFPFPVLPALPNKPSVEIGKAPQTPQRPAISVPPVEVVKRLSKDSVLLQGLFQKAQDLVKINLDGLVVAASQSITPSTSEDPYCPTCSPSPTKTPSTTPSITSSITVSSSIFPTRTPSRTKTPSITPSNQTVVTPSNVSASDGTFVDRVLVTWSGSSGNYFKVFRAGELEDEVVEISGWIPDFSFDDFTGLEDKTYYYLVKASANGSGDNEGDFGGPDDGWRSSNPDAACETWSIYNHSGAAIDTDSYFSCGYAGVFETIDHILDEETRNVCTTDITTITLDGVPLNTLTSDFTVTKLTINYCNLGGPSPTPTKSVTGTPSRTPSITASIVSPSRTPTRTKTPSNTVSVTPTQDASPSVTPSITVSPFSPSVTPSLTATISLSATPSVSVTPNICVYSVPYFKVDTICNSGACTIQTGVTKVVREGTCQALTLVDIDYVWVVEITSVEEGFSTYSVNPVAVTGNSDAVVLFSTAVKTTCYLSNVTKKLYFKGVLIWEYYFPSHNQGCFDGGVHGAPVCCVYVSPTPTKSVTASISPTPTTTSSITPSLTPSETPSNTPSITVTPSETRSVTITPSTTPSITVTPSVTPTMDASPSQTPSITTTPSITPSITRTPSVTPSITVSPSITPSITRSITVSISVSKSISVSPSVTPSFTTTPSVTPTTDASPSVTPSVTPSITVSPSITPSITVSETVSPSITATPSISPSRSTCDCTNIYFEYVSGTYGCVTATATLCDGSPYSECITVGANTTQCIREGAFTVVEPAISETFITYGAGNCGTWNCGVPTPSATPSATPTLTLTATPTTTPSLTPSITLSASRTPTRTRTPSRTPTRTRSTSPEPPPSPSPSPSACCVSGFTGICGSLGCCDGVTYNLSTQGCCEGVIYNQATHACCYEQGPYNVSTQQCCTCF